jgi:hypothetical protein
VVIAIIHGANGAYFLFKEKENIDIDPCKKT